MIILDSIMKELVWLGRKPIAGIKDASFAYHWAVKIGADGEAGDWYEVDGAGKRGKGDRNTINGCDTGRPYWGQESRNNAKAYFLAGHTTKSEDEIAEFNREWLRKHPWYDAVADNCQIFSYDLIQFATDGLFNLPPMEAGVGAWADAFKAKATNTKTYAGARATTGKAGAQGTWYGAEAEGPSAGAEVRAGQFIIEVSLSKN